MILVSSPVQSFEIWSSTGLSLDNIVLKRYNEEDDKLERYVQDLLLEEKQKDLNLHQIIKAKKSLYLGRSVKVFTSSQINTKSLFRGVPLIAADGSNIRLNPKPTNMFYKPEESRDRLSINWNVPDEKKLKVNVNDKSEETMQACIYKPPLAHFSKPTSNNELTLLISLLFETTKIIRK